MSDQYSTNLTPEKYQEIKTKLETENLNDFPPLFKQARNLAKQVWMSGIEFAKGKPLLSSAEKAAARISICEACEFFKEDRCLKCGCFMKAKVHFEATSCPLNKWWPQHQNKQVSLVELPKSTNVNSSSIQNHVSMKEFTDLVMMRKDPNQPRNFTFQGINYYVDLIDGIPSVSVINSDQ